MGSIGKQVKALIRGDRREASASFFPGLGRDAVLWAYRLFLDREAENKEVVDEHLRKCSTTQELRANFIYSTEFREKNPAFHVPVLLGDEPGMLIEDTCTQHDLEKLFDHVQRTWQELGKTEPHWSVVVSEEYRQATIESNKDAFYRTGEQHVAQLFGSLERNQVQHCGFKTCLDYGCGVGRITRHLAKRFEQVFAYDISLSHLRCADDHLTEESVSNVVLNRIKRVRDIESLPKVDLAYSMLVLQHNPPPVMAFIIKGLIRSLNPGGIAFFQAPTYRLGYTFSVADYFATGATRHEMEMHVLSQSRIFEIVQRAGARVLEVIDDGWTGIRFKEVSNTFVIQKTASRPF
ncbi:MAG TPA: methyltransferase domain-containing protein [Pyrinomonadaceae bacterium]|jgi:2-polyprenyl-3-methyl-5-hydroxy-6-metoxy-1,4-benzoquinol methylase|nr:methyltransferase domain-containing protein [Pyrinomonadaceae bacterium]